MAGHLTTIHVDPTIQFVSDRLGQHHSGTGVAFLWVCNLNSTYETFVNSQRTGKHVFRDGDRVGVGGEAPVVQGTKEDRR